MSRVVPLIRADVVETRRIDLEGISLNGFMVRKMLFQSGQSQNVPNIEELVNAISNLSGQVTTLTSNASLLRQEISNVQSTVSSIQTFINGLSSAGPTGPEGPMGPSGPTYDDGPLWKKTSLLQQEMDSIQEQLSNLIANGPTGPFVGPTGARCSCCDPFIEDVVKPNVLVLDDFGNWNTPDPGTCCCSMNLWST